MTKSERQVIGTLAMQITVQAKARYALHHRVRTRILSDLGTDGVTTLNQKLTNWWDLPRLADFQAEVKKALKCEIPVRDRDGWEDYLRERKAEHEGFTREIIRLETELNERVYALFDLTPDEIKLIEESTKYRYGEV